MHTWIALLRGINVGGNNIVPMAQLRSHLESLGLQNIRTYIQSGNVVFDSADGTALSHAANISGLIEAKFGFKPKLFVLDLESLQMAIAENPFPDAVSDPKTLHFSFLAKPAVDADLDALDAFKSPTEEFELTERVFYLHAPDGIGRSKLAANVEKRLGVATTSRNFRTVEKLLLMATDHLT